MMGISAYPSSVVLPNVPQPYPAILAFLVARFPRVPQALWEERIAAGKVLDGDGRPITLDSGYAPLKRIFYFREVQQEPVIPFQEEIVFQNDDILVACKPHFLPVTPGGPYVEECLLNRLRRRTGAEYLAPVNRIDRATAGLVMFSVNRKTSGQYHALFRSGRVEKRYQALAPCTRKQEENEWLVEDRIVTGEPWFRMRSVPGEVNARSRIGLAEMRSGTGRFELSPLTGRTHQLRIHLSGLGFGILNDRLYPQLQPEVEDDFARPLQLIAQGLRFRDPVAGRVMEFRSERKLLW
jgi:tRNA pseudouridine32 synthase/23S rRNA pseudouridine746 synthase